MTEELSKKGWVVGILSFSIVGFVVLGHYVKPAAAQPKKFNNFRSMPH